MNQVLQTQTGYWGEAVELLNVMTGYSLRATRGGLAVLHTRPMQRLIRLRQVGLGYMIWPSAENTRLSHSIGTEYWAWRLLESLYENSYAAAPGDQEQPVGNARRLAHMRDMLGDGLSLELIARLFALVHDIALLPLGHTLQYQFGFFQQAGAESQRVQRAVAAVQQELECSLELAAIAHPEQRRGLLQSLKRHLDVVECCFGVGKLLRGKDWHPAADWISAEQMVQWLPALVFLYDLVHTTVSADVIDFMLRDTAGAAQPHTFDELLLDSMCVFRTPVPEPLKQAPWLAQSNATARLAYIYRFGIHAYRERVCHDVITGVATVYRARFEVAQRVFYSDTKCAADAMLDGALRYIDRETSQVAGASGPFSEPRLMEMGDDELLGLVEGEEARVRAASNGNLKNSAGRPFMQELMARRLFQEVFCVQGWSELSQSARKLATDSLRPSVRDEVERQIMSQVAGLHPGDFVFSCRPRDMQSKPPQMLVGWKTGPLTFDSIAQREGYGREVLALHQQYSDLWSLSVYAAPWVRNRNELARACQQIFQTMGGSDER